MVLDIAKWISTTEENPWEQMKITYALPGENVLEVTGKKLQTVEGFGGCFNELEWIALSKLGDEKRQEVISALFDKEKGCKFSFCRMPIGASDYAAEWYSYNENEDDYQMERFSIDRDHSFLMPFIKKALEHRPDMKLFASPWSPPTWMKFPKAYNFGTLRMEEKVLDAYALYLEKFVEAYRKEGISIHQIHVQNEPFADQKFPSCLWTGEQYRIFIKNHLGPLFRKAHVPAEIWFGTLNGPEFQEYDTFIDQVLFDREARQYIKGIGYQWAGKYAVQRTHESFPELKLMQTENECGDGTNTWAYARYIFNLIRHYFANGVNAYIYWNMVLEPNGRSTWGWNQNSLVTVNAEKGEIVYNPEFYLMKHFSHFILPGAVRLETKGHWNGAALAFENPGGEVVVVACNALDRERSFTFRKDGEERTFSLKSYSFNTFVFN